MKYRLVKETNASGNVYWKVEKKILWWWENVNLFCNQHDAIYLMERLRAGVPEKTIEVICDTRSPSSD
jgi:hypothetical protein